MHSITSFIITLLLFYKLMWWSIVYLLAIPVFSWFAIYLVREIQSRKRMSFYKDQGFHSFTSLIIPGFARLFLQGLGQKNELAQLIALHNDSKSKGSPGVVFNDSQTGKAFVTLTDIGLIKEFAIKDNDVAKKYAPFDLKLSPGFVFFNKGEALFHRAVFSEFFRIDNLNKLVPLIVQELDQCFKEDVLAEPKNPAFNSAKLVEKIIIRLSNQFLFGEGTDIPFAENGLSLSEEIVEIFTTVGSPQIGMNPLNFITNDWANKLNLLPAARRIQKRIDSVVPRMRALIQRRIDHPELFIEQRKSICLMNLMLDHNERSKPEEKLTVDQMISHFNMFLSASFDGVRTMTSSALFNLAKNPNLVTSLREKTKDLDRTTATFLELEENPLLNRFIREIIRISTMGLTAPRELLQDCTLGRYQFKKGDLIFLPLITMLFDDRHFASGSEFDIDSINDENKKDYIPFYLGKRNCIGQNLALLLFKVITVYVVQRYDLTPVHERMYFQASASNAAIDAEVQFVKLNL